MKTLEELQPLIIKWAKDRGLTPEDYKGQLLKALEEQGETAKEITLSNHDKTKMEFGDMFITLINSAWMGGVQMKFDFPDNSRNSSIFIWDYSVVPDFVSVWDLRDICMNHGYDLTECANMAWEKIKDRKGKKVGKTFVKS